MLSSDADIYLLDEPFSAMHPQTMEAMRELLFQQKDKTIIITHQLDDQLSLFDEVSCMEQGNAVKNEV